MVRNALFVVVIAFLSKSGAQTSALGLADSLYSVGNYTTAINEYAKVGTHKSDLQIARAYQNMGNYDNAILQYEAVIKKDASLQIAKFELGKLYLRAKNSENALGIFKELTEKNANPEYHYHLGLALQDVGNLEASVTAFKDGAALDSTHLKSLFQLGKYYLSVKEYNTALHYINKGIYEYPNDVALINLKALTFYNNDQYKEAKPLFESLLERGEKKEFVYEKLANCYYKLWELEQAKSTYRKLLEFESAIPRAYFGLGGVYWRDEKLDSAAIYFNKAIEAKKPFLAAEYSALAGLAREGNNLNKAMEYYKKAFEEDTENYMHYYQICTLADQLYKDPKIKLQYYERFIAQFGMDQPYLSQTVAKRISQLKQEIAVVPD